MVVVVEIVLQESKDLNSWWCWGVGVVVEMVVVIVEMAVIVL